MNVCTWISYINIEGCEFGCKSKRRRGREGGSKNGTVPKICQRQVCKGGVICFFWGGGLTISGTQRRYLSTVFNRHTSSLQFDGWFQTGVFFDPTCFVCFLEGRQDWLIIRGSCKTWETLAGMSHWFTLKSSSLNPDLKTDHFKYIFQAYSSIISIRCWSMTLF